MFSEVSNWNSPLPLISLKLKVIPMSLQVNLRWAAPKNARDPVEQSLEHRPSLRLRGKYRQASLLTQLTVKEIAVIIRSEILQSARICSRSIIGLVQIKL